MSRLIASALLLLLHGAFLHAGPAGGTASLVLGQGTFSRGAGITADGTALNDPRSVAIDNARGRVFVVDSVNNRVLWWNDRSRISDGTAADGVLGQSDVLVSSARAASDVTLYRPVDACTDAAGALWIVDRGNNRVLRFSGIFASGMAADLVIGQPDFAGDAGNRSGPPDGTTLDQPSGACIDASGALWVADTGNNRVLRYRPPFMSGMAADLVLGQMTFEANLVDRAGNPGPATLDNPCDVTIAPSGEVWVSDTFNHRVVRYGGTLTNGVAADLVLGQADFFSAEPNRGGEVTAATLDRPSGLATGDGYLFVADAGNHRVLRYGRELSSGTGAALVLGQSDFVSHAANRGAPVSAGALAMPYGVFIEGTGDVWVADSRNNRVLKFASLEPPAAGAGVRSVNPTSANNSMPVDVIIAGENFLEGTSVRLSKAGQPDIDARFVTIVSSVQLSCRFDITDAATGPWNVVLAPSGEGRTLADAFAVSFASAAVRTILRARSYRIGVETPRGHVSVEIPGGTFAEDLTLAIDVPESMPPVETAEFMPSDIAIRIAADRELRPQKDMTVSFYYGDTSLSGLDENKCVVACFDTETARWLQVASRLSPPRRALVAHPRQLSILRVLQRVARQDLTGVRVYPNPYRPDSGDRFDNPVAGRGVVFSGLTGSARIRIFTIAGDEVVDINDRSGNGMLVWDTRNSDNQQVASGVYLYHVTNPDNGSQRAKGKFAIIR